MRLIKKVYTFFKYFLLNKLKYSVQSYLELMNVAYDKWLGKQDSEQMNV